MSAESKENMEISSSKNLVFRGKNSGNYTWNIRDKQLIDNILNAQNKQLFESESFIMSSLKWQIKLYPNGHNEAARDSVIIFLKLVSMPDELDKFSCSYSVRCNNTKSCWTSMVKFNKNGQTKGWANRVLLLSEWKLLSINCLSITLSININHIVLKNINYKKKSQFIHKIDNKTINIIKNSYNIKQMESEIFDNIWRLTYSPNGYDKNSMGYFSMYLSLCTLPPFIKGINAKFNVTCNETEDCFSSERHFNYDHQTWGKTKFMELKNIKSLQTVTFRVDVEITDIVFIDGMDNVDNVDGKNKNIHHIYYDPVEIHTILSSICHDDDDDDDDDDVISNNNTLDSMSMEIKENNNMIKEIENNMNEIRKQINDLRLIINEENKNEENIDTMKKEMESIKENVNKLIIAKSTENKKYKAMKQWMTNVVELPEYIDIFIENGFESLDIIKEVKLNDLTMIGIDKLGHKIKITKEIAKLNQQQL